MARSWSDTAQAALDAYPWTHETEKEKAREEAELVSFGPQIELEDLPLPLRRWWKARKPVSAFRHPWNGESWKDATTAFERDILAQALAASGGNVAAAARALRTTARVVGYKGRKYGLINDEKEKRKEQ